MPDIADVFRDLLEDGAEVLHKLSPKELREVRKAALEIVRLTFAEENSRYPVRRGPARSLHRDDVTPIGYGKEKK